MAVAVVDGGVSGGSAVPPHDGASGDVGAVCTGCAGRDHLLSADERGAVDAVADVAVWPSVRNGDRRQALSLPGAAAALHLLDQVGEGGVAVAGLALPGACRQSRGQGPVPIPAGTMPLAVVVMSSQLVVSVPLFCVRACVGTSKPMRACWAMSRVRVSKLM